MGHGRHLREPFEQALDEAQMGCAIAIGQKPIVADSDQKPLGQGVEEKAVDKVHRTRSDLFEDIISPGLCLST